MSSARRLLRLLPPVAAAAAGYLAGRGHSAADEDPSAAAPATPSIAASALPAPEGTREPGPWPVCPSVWGIVREPARHAGPPFWIQGFLLAEFEHAELVQTRQELTVVRGQWRFHVPLGSEQQLSLAFEPGVSVDPLMLSDREVRLYGTVQPKSAAASSGT